MIIPNRRSFLIGLGATIVVANEVKAALIMPLKNIIRPDIVNYMIVGCRHDGYGDVIDHDGKVIMSLRGGCLFEQTAPSFDLIAAVKASNLPVQIITYHSVTKEKIISQFNGEMPFVANHRNWSS
jgi:hypothetical protein